MPTEQQILSEEVVRENTALREEIGTLIQKTANQYDQIRSQQSRLDHVINLCKEKASGYRQSAEGNLARETWIDRAEVMESFAREIENLDHQGD